MRRAMTEEVSVMIEQEQDSSLFLVDIGVWGFQKVLSRYPDRAMNIGIFEDGMMSVAAGMALRGMNPTIYGITPFIVDRTLEQLKLDFAYQKLRGNIITTGASYDFSIAGYSHYCPEDIQLLKSIPGIEIVAPGTAGEFRQLFAHTHKNQQLTYYRLSDHVNLKEEDVVFGKARILQRGTKATVIAVSTMHDEVMDACKEMDVNVLYYTTLSPFDEETLAGVENSGKILLCEPYMEGSLSYDVLHALRGKKIQLETIGVPREIIRFYGKKKEKDERLGLTAEVIRQRLYLLIGMQGGT